MAEEQKAETGFKDLLTNIMNKRWYITALVLGSFVLIIAGIFFAITTKVQSSAEWKELLLLLLGAFNGSYGKIIDYWFSDQDKDKLLVAKMDEENDTPEMLMAKMDKGISSGDLKLTGYTPTQVIPDAFVQGASAARDMAKVENTQNFELAKEQQKQIAEKLGELSRQQNKSPIRYMKDSSGHIAKIFTENYEYILYENEVFGKKHQDSQYNNFGSYNDFLKDLDSVIKYLETVMNKEL